MITVNPNAPKEDEQIWRAILALGRKIADEANGNTTAPIQVRAHFVDRGPDRRVRIGPRGAAAIAVEFGTAMFPARRPVKRALDRFRI